MKHEFRGRREAKEMIGILSKEREVFILWNFQNYFMMPLGARQMIRERGGGTMDFSPVQTFSWLLTRNQLLFSLRQRNKQIPSQITPFYCEFCEQTFYFLQFAEQTIRSSLFDEQYIIFLNHTRHVSSGWPLMLLVILSLCTSCHDLLRQIHKWFCKPLVFAWIPLWHTHTQFSKQRPLTSALSYQLCCKDHPRYSLKQNFLPELNEGAIHPKLEWATSSTLLLCYRCSCHGTAQDQSHDWGDDQTWTS